MFQKYTSYPTSLEEVKSGNGDNLFFKSAFSVDCVIFGFDNGVLKILLVDCDLPTFKGLKSLPGGLVYPNENLENAANRVLCELTGLENVYMDQVRTFGRVDRHPLGRVITVAYFSLVKVADYHLHAPAERNAEWVPISEVQRLAFDHTEILAACRGQLKREVRAHPIGFELLPKHFTLTELQNLYQAVLETPLDKRNFRKKILSMKLLVELEHKQEGVTHRPASLYRFDENRYQTLQAEGFNFEL